MLTSEALSSYGSPISANLIEAPVGTAQYDIAKEQLIKQLTGKLVSMAIYPDGGGMSNGCTVGVHAYFVDMDGSSNDANTAGDTGYNTKGGELKPVIAEFDITRRMEGTSNVGELTALLDAITLVRDLRIAGVNFKYVNLFQDSRYALDCYSSWMENWARKGWKRHTGEEVKNVDILKAMIAVKKELRELAQRISMHWVKGHGTDIGNNKADALATAGKSLPMHASRFVVKVEGKPMEVTKDVVEAVVDAMDESVKETPLISWDKQDPNPMTKQSSYYFITGQPETKGMRKYMMANLAKDAVFGERHPGNGYCVALLPKPDPLVERIEKLTSSLNAMGQVCELSLKNLMVKKTYDDVVKASEADSIALLEQQICLEKSGTVKITNLTFRDKPLVSVLNPPLRAMIALKFFNELDSILTQFVAGELDNSPSVCITDVTDQFFVMDTTKKKPELKIVPTFTNADKMVKINVKLFKDRDDIRAIPFVVGNDIPMYNSIGALKKLNPKVSVVAVMENHDAVRYYTVFKADCGIGIFASLHANYVFLKA